MIKYAIVSPDKKGTIDPPVFNILTHFPNLTTLEDADVLLMPITRLNNFEFNTELLNNKKPYILFDYCEYGANDWDRTGTHIFGINTVFFPGFESSEWMEFDAWVKGSKPVVYFKRELLKIHMKDNRHPIEYPCYFPPTEIQSREQFDARPLEVLFNWGHSHESRVNLHANIFLNAGRIGYHLIDNIYHIVGAINEVNGSRKIWASILTPSHSRFPLSRIIDLQSGAKITVSLPGAGVKCFRHSEAPVNSIMFMQEDNLAWSFPWIKGENCLKVDIGEDFESIKGSNGCPEIAILELLHLHPDTLDLYQIYLQGLDNIDRYRIGRYLEEYVLPLIEKAI